ncbi:MAG TPA: hypothetical protein DDW52_16490 [Planctomycetaceae bacterium]|nr:hypothetical protein [Planctomycetaceae bacterium]
MKARIRFNLTHCFALIALAAIWTAVYKFNSEATRMAYELESFREFAPVLLVDKKDKLNVLTEVEDWTSERAWQVYVPEHSSVVVRAINTETSVTSDFPLFDGRSRIVLRTVYPDRRNGPQMEEEVLLYVNRVRHILSSRKVAFKDRYKVPTVLPQITNPYVQSPAREFILHDPSTEGDVLRFPWKLSLTPSALQRGS